MATPTVAAVSVLLLGVGPSSPDWNPWERARSYSSQRCQDALRSASALPSKVQRWVGDHYVSHALGLVYIRNQKAASTSIMGILRALDRRISASSTDALERVVLPYGFTAPSDRAGSRSKMWQRVWSRSDHYFEQWKNYTIFSFLRDDCIESSFMAGYREISYVWAEKAGRGPGRGSRAAQSYDIDCQDNPTNRLAVFVEDALRGRNMGLPGMHCWPQAHKMDVGIRLHFIGSLTNFDRDMRTLLHSRGFDFLAQDKVGVGKRNSKLNVRKRHKRCTHPDISATNVANVSGELRSLIRAFLRPDETCFRLSACQG